MSALQATDQKFMALALRLAEQGRCISHPNPSVGCVIVKAGRVVGEGHTGIAGAGHAEANALRDAGSAASQATVYVTLEPCSFIGRTPACATGLIEAGVTRVVVAMLDPDPRNAGRGVAMLEAAGIEVKTPFMADSAARIMQGHIKRFSKGLPLVRLKLAMTLDGKTALASGESKWITSAQARADVQQWRARSAAIVTGVDTVIADNPRLTVRAEELAIAEADVAAGVARPVYVLDTQGRIPVESHLLQMPDTVVVTARPDLNLPCEALVLPLEGDRINLNALLNALAQREHSEVLFECGATLAGAILNAGLVDELILYVAPRFIGASGRSLLNLPEVDRMCDLAELTINDVTQIGPDIRLIAGPA